MNALQQFRTEGRRILLFLGICLAALNAVAQDTTTRTSNSIIETCKNIGKGKRIFIYTSREAKALCDSLESSSESIGYQMMYPDKKQLEKAADAGKVFRDKVLREFTTKTDARIKLEGGRLTIRVYVKPDGSVTLKDISCSFNMLDIMGSNAIDKLISIVNSNKTAPSRIKGDYRTEWTCTLKFPYLKDERDRVVDEIIERKVRNDALETMYRYNTLKERRVVIMLENNTRKVSYHKMYPEENGVASQVEACDRFRDHVFSEFAKQAKNADKLKGKKIMIRVYSTPDGAVTLHSITAMEDLLTPLGAKDMTKLIEIIKSYKFKPSTVEEDCRLEWKTPLALP